MANSKGKEKVEDDSSEYYEPCCIGTNTCLGPFPPGFRFTPKDEELVLHYLRPKVNNMSLPPNNMHEIDLYDPNKSEERCPEQLIANYRPQGENEWYFFTSRDRKYPNGSRPNRTSGGGFWKASGKDDFVLYNGNIVGYKKTLVFYKGRPATAQKTSWIMHEFRLTKDNAAKTPKLMNAKKSERIKLGDWVLCKIHYNGKGAKQQDDCPPRKRRRSAPETECEPLIPNSTHEEANVKTTTTIPESSAPIPSQNVWYPNNQVSRPSVVVADITSTLGNINMNNHSANYNQPAIVSENPVTCNNVETITPFVQYPMHQTTFYSREMNFQNPRPYSFPSYEAGFQNPVPGPFPSYYEPGFETAMPQPFYHERNVDEPRGQFVFKAGNNNANFEVGRSTRSSTMGHSDLNGGITTFEVGSTSSTMDPFDLKGEFSNTFEVGSSNSTIDDANMNYPDLNTELYMSYLLSPSPDNDASIPDFTEDFDDPKFNEPGGANDNKGLPASYR